MRGRQTYRLAEELTTCPSCRSHRITHLHAVRSPRLRKTTTRIIFVSGCHACGAIFVNPPKPEAERAAYYEEEGGWNARVPERVERALALTGAPTPRVLTDEEEGKGIVQAAAVQARRRFGTIDGLPALDFGCGFGMFLELLAAYGLRPTGLDPATRHLITQYPMVESMPERPTYAIILAKHVLEHLPNPLAILEQFRNALLPNGVVALGMPTLDGLVRHQQLKYCVNESQHVSAFTRRSLSALLRRAGLEPIAFYQDPGREHRMRCVAVPARRRRVWWALRDARLEFLRYRRTTGEPLLKLARPIREWAYEENQRFIKPSKVRAKESRDTAADSA